ncbi:MAG: AAA family ATPase [Betaproteobacteria bacterium]|nr:AAA family ATPase [Betaproteobacteria bacterium]
MKINKLSISNFLTIGRADIELDDRGLLLIQGVNDDDPSAESNGAGKSSVVDALCWGIYGTTARGVSGDAVVNKTTKKDCCVHITMTDCNQQYRIVRWRKGTNHKNSVSVYEKDLTTGAEMDLSKGTDRETQEVIGKVMGCSLDVFMAAVYAGQERMPDLPGMTDKMLKTLIEEAAGVEVLTEAYATVRDRYNRQKSIVDALAATQTTAIGNGARLSNEVAQLEVNSEDFEKGRRDRAKAELAKTIPINDEISRATTALKTWDEAASRVDLDKIDAKLKAHKTEEAERNRLDTIVRALDMQVASAKSAVALKKRETDAAEASLKSIEEQIGKPCGECGKVYCEHDMEAARKARQETIAELKKTLLTAASEAKALVARANEAQESAVKFKAGMTDVTAVALRQRELSNLLNSIDASKRMIESKRKDIENIKAVANAKLTETNPWTKAVESKRQEIRHNDATLSEMSERIGKAGEELELLADAVKVFGPAGVRAHILDTVTPYLNDRTRDYLGALADGNIHATWTTLAKTAKGELKEKFNIGVTNDKGAESFAGLSGGEKRKVRLATAMALQDMVASRAIKPIDIFVADEVDHALDEAGLERLMGILDRKARERGTVLVISHNSLSDWIDSVITVTKAAGLATVSGAVARGF